MECELRELSVADGQDIHEMLQEIGPGENGFHNPYHAAEAAGFADYLEVQLDMSAGIGIDPATHVPQTTYWLIVNGRPVGMGKLRPRLNDYFKVHGGHIGYCIRPSERGKGYGTIMLRELLKAARVRGVNDVLLTCGKDNIGSRNVIERNGGELEAIEDGGCRYWIRYSGQNSFVL